MPRKRFAMFALMLALVTALIIGTATFADASHSYRYGHGFGKPDSNGYVPQYYPWTVGTCHDGVIGRTHYSYRPSASYGPHVMWIEYDRCEMKRLGATDAGWQRIKAHELAHSRGWAHLEGHPSYNAAYHPKMTVR